LDLIFLEEDLRLLRILGFLKAFLEDLGFLEAFLRVFFFFPAISTKYII
jgi:hypothetical protein